jgi:hypothetical protein
MASQEDVRRICLSLQATTQDPNGFRFFVEGRQFVWSWLERVDPNRARVPNPEVIAVSVGNEIEKETLIEMNRCMAMPRPEAPPRRRRRHEGLGSDAPANQG